VGCLAPSDRLCNPPCTARWSTRPPLRVRPSCRELDALVETAWRIPGVYGSRMTGAGFGGCTVSLVADEAVEEFLERVPSAYRARIGVSPTVYVCTPEGGAEILANE